jgi:very-short-patch-repair endonuclease
MGRGPGGEATPSALPTNSEVQRALGGLNPALIKLARELRHHSTEAEDQLWQCLRARRFNGLKFRRQHPLGLHYISDFYCAETKVSVELDGAVHNSRRAQWGDGIRHRQIQEAGVRVVRFKNERVKQDLEGVLSEIASVCEAQVKRLRPHPPTPSPSDGERARRRGEGEASGPIPEPHRMGRGPGGEAVWRQAGQLRVGDSIVADETGRAARLVSVERILTEEPVYDLTVEGDHSFITEAGVAHNCGSGTTAYVAEQWGRRWITMDTSRVPLALARQRLLTATFPYYELKDEERGPAGGFVYKRKQNNKGEETGGIVPHITLKSIANNEPPAEEVLVDRPEVKSGIIRVTGPFTFEATIPTPVELERGVHAASPSEVSSGVETSSASSDTTLKRPEGRAPEDYGAFVDRMLEVLRKSPVLRVEGNRTVQLKNIRPPARSLSLSAEAMVDARSVLECGSPLPLSHGTPGANESARGLAQSKSSRPNEAATESKPVAIVFGPENGAVSEKLVYEAAREAHAKNYTHLYVIGFAIQPNARALIEKCSEVMGVRATYVQATPDLMMGDLLKNMRSSQIFSVCGLPEVKVSKVQSPKSKVSYKEKLETQYQVELLGLDVFDPISMEVDHQSGNDVPAWLLDTDYNGLCFHVSQAFFPRTGAWENLKKALKGDYEESVWDHLAGTVSAPFAAGEHGQIAVKVIDQRGNELLVVKSLKEAGK